LNINGLSALLHAGAVEKSAEPALWSCDDCQEAPRMSAKSETNDARHSRLTADRESEILRATIKLLGELGYEGLTMPAVARLARCSTATIYRQWNGKSGLVIAALQAHRSGPPPTPSTGSLRGDLLAVISDLADIAEPELALMAALAHASLRDQSLADAMRVQLSGPAVTPLDLAIERATERGEILPTAKVRQYAHHVLLSISLARHLAEGKSPDREYLVGFVDDVLLPMLESRKPEAR
jgi:AcrR family transcriptional regulator